MSTTSVEELEEKVTDLTILGKDLLTAIDLNTECLNDGEAWVKLQYLADEIEAFGAIL